MHAKYTLFFLLAVYFDEGSPFNITNKLAKLENECLSDNDYLEMTGYQSGITPAYHLVSENMPQFIETIGLTELRKALGFGPVRTWTYYNYTEPNEEELATANTLEDYYNLKEPKSKERSLNDYHYLSWDLPQKDFPTFIAFLDRRLPSLRAMFRKTFEDSKNAHDKEEIDKMIKKFQDLVGDIEKARKKWIFADCGSDHYAKDYEYPERARANQTLLLEIEAKAAAALQPDPSTFNITHKLAKIGSTCFSKADYQEMAGHPIYPRFARYARHCLIPSLQTIGLNELRRSLDFEPLGPWKKFKRTEPSKEEIEGAKTLREYYDLKEPRSVARDVRTINYTPENCLPPCLKFLNERLPSIRTIFRMKYKEIRGSDEVDRKVIDKLIEGYNEVENIIRNAPAPNTGRLNFDCWARTLG